MAEKTLNFHKLSDCVINQLKKQNYIYQTGVTLFLCKFCFLY